jgi:ParB-like chromosome segregation protein Spo0J
MEQTIELRIVDPKTLIYADKRDPRQVPADRLSDAALKANSNAIGFIQPPLFSEEADGTLTIIAGRRRIKSAIANKLKEMAILVKRADPLDDMRAVAENVVRAPISPIDLWRSIEDLASKNWTEEAIATAFAVPLRQVRKLRLLGSIHPAMLEHMGRGDMPEERYLRTIAAAPLSEQAAVWTKQKPKKGQTAAWYAIANSLMKRQMFARDASARRNRPPSASSGPKTSSPRPTRTAATRPTSTPFLALSSPGSKPTFRRTGKSFRSTTTALPSSRRARPGSGAANPGKRIASRSPSTRETGPSARSISRPLPPLRRRRRPAPAQPKTLQPLSPGPVPTSPRRAAR